MSPHGCRASRPVFRAAEPCPLARLVLRGKISFGERGVQMTDSRHPSMINGLPVVRAPAEIDGDTAEKFRAVLLRAAADGHATIVVDLTGTRFCDSGGLKALDAAHQRAQDEGGELRLVLPASGTIVRILAITGLNRCIPCFTGLDQALAAPQPTHPRQRGRPPEWAKPVMYGM